MLHNVIYIKHPPFFASFLVLPYMLQVLVCPNLERDEMDVMNVCRLSVSIYLNITQCSAGVFPEP